MVVVVEKYQRLAGEMTKIYNQDVVTIPVVFGVSGIVLKQQRRKISAFNDVYLPTSKKHAILGTVDVFLETFISYML